MHSTRQARIERGAAAAIAAVTTALFIVAAAGCNQLNNPFKDSTAYAQADMTTPSADIYLAQPQGRTLAQRNLPASDVYYESGLVTHWPLWFEDPFEYKGNDRTNPVDRDAPDNVFAWNAVDYFDIAYGPSRMILNAFGLAVSVFPEPPGKVMESNGRIQRWFGQYDYDNGYAKPGDEPPDYNDLNRTRYREHGGGAHPEDPNSHGTGATATPGPGANPPAQPAGSEPEVVPVDN